MSKKFKLVPPRRKQISPEKGIWLLDYEEYRPAPYYAKVIGEEDYGKGTWNILVVGVFKKKVRDEDVQIGQYTRNYHALFDTFFPFQQGEKWYALYSTRYTATRVMSLPDCKDVCGEDPDGFGFCPVEYYVPINEPVGEYANFALIAGCVWGDDSSWKVQHIDLSTLSESRITRSEPFGYIELHSGTKLPEAVDYWEQGYIEIVCKRNFCLGDSNE